MGPRNNKRKISAEASAAAPDDNPAVLDEASRRRQRNRISQRTFRERKLLYIKELESRSRASTQTESERNLALTQELAALREATISVRSQVLKISCALNAVGAELGEFFNLTNGLSEGGDRNDKSDSDCDMYLAEQRPLPSLSKPDRVSPVTIVDFNSNRNTEHVARSSPTSKSKAVSPLPPTLTLESEVERSVVPETEIADTNVGYGRPSMDEQSKIDEEPRRDEQTGMDERGGMDEEAGMRAFNLNLEHSEHSHISGSAPSISQNDGSTLDLDGLELSSWCSYVPSPSDIAHPGFVFPSGHYPTVSPSPFPALPGIQIQSSMFSEHIETLELEVRSQLELCTDKASRQALYRSCSTIMNLFVQNAWPTTASVWFKSQVPEIIGPILRWRICPSMENYNRLLPQYRPTPLQLSAPHSAVIDWIPYAPLRDRVINFYNNSVVLDRLLCDMVDSYVIEVDDLSRVLPRAPCGRAYFGIWNIFAAIDAATAAATASLHASSLSSAVQTNSVGIENDFDEPHLDSLVEPLDDGADTHGDLFSSTYPQNPFSNYMALSVDTRSYGLLDVLATPASVLKLSHDVPIYAAKSWKLDRTLFEKYPELKFDGHEQFVAKGRSCRIPTAPPKGPRIMTGPVLETYQRTIRECLRSLR